MAGQHFTRIAGGTRDVVSKNRWFSQSKIHDAKQLKNVDEMLSIYIVEKIGGWGMIKGELLDPSTRASKRYNTFIVYNATISIVVTENPAVDRSMMKPQNMVNPPLPNGIHIRQTALSQ